jgi:orotate phosphoribosyltransferase
MKWEKDSFYNFIIENNVIGFFKTPLKLKSGRLSYWYVNWRNISEDVFLLDQLTDYVLSFVSSLNLKPDCFYGIPEGATKLGIITQFKWAKMQSNYDKGVYNLSMGRAVAKEHGDPKDKTFLGYPKGRVVIIEDTITTGDSLLKTIETFLDTNIQIIAAICLTNRNEIRDDRSSIEDVIRGKGISLFPMSNAIELLPKIYQLQNPGIDIKVSIEDYFSKYGVKSIKLA